MTVEARLPDGTSLQFPDNTPQEVIDRTVKQHLNVDRGPEMVNAEGRGFTPDSVFQQMGQGDEVPLLQQTRGPTPETRQALITGKEVPGANPIANTGLLSPALLGATAGSVLFPPLSIARANQLVGKAFPRVTEPLVEGMNTLVAPGLFNIAGQAARGTAGFGVRFARPVAGSGAGGFVGGGAESLAEQGIVGPEEVLAPFEGFSLENLPTEEQISKAYEQAKERGTEMALLELGGSVIFAPFARLLGPNADLMAENGTRVLEFARKNNLPLMPSAATGARFPVMESFVSSVFPGGMLTMKTNQKAMARVLEAPVDDHVNFVTTAFNLEKPQFIGRQGERLIGGSITGKEQNNINLVRGLLQDSAQVVPGFSTVGNVRGAPTSSLLVNGDKLIQNIERSRQAGKLKDLPQETLEALQNFAMYAKVVGPDVANPSISSRLLGPLTVPAAAAGTGALVYPLVTGQQGVAGTPATGGEIGGTVGATAFLAWMATSMASPRGSLNKWLTKGFLDSKTTREMMRLSVDTATKGTGQALTDRPPELGGQRLPERPPELLAPNTLGVF